MPAALPDPRSAGQLSFTITEPAPRVTVVTAVGEIDAATITALVEHLAQAEASSDRVVLDLSRVEFLSCAGLRVLHELHGRSRFAVVATGHPVPRTLKVTGMDQVLEVHASLATAIDFSKLQDRSHRPDMA